MLLFYLNQLKSDSKFHSAKLAGNSLSGIIGISSPTQCHMRVEHANMMPRKQKPASSLLSLMAALTFSRPSPRPLVDTRLSEMGQWGQRSSARLGAQGPLACSLGQSFPSSVLPHLQVLQGQVKFPTTWGPPASTPDQGWAVCCPLFHTPMHTCHKMGLQGAWAFMRDRKGDSFSFLLYRKFPRLEIHGLRKEKGRIQGEVTRLISAVNYLTTCVCV